MEVFASDAEGKLYAYCHPTDVRVVREEYTEEALAGWSLLNAWAGTVKGTFIRENEGMGVWGRQISGSLEENLSYGFFRKIAEVPRGTAGSSLAMAHAASDIMHFASGRHISLLDNEELRSAMLTAWEGLAEEEQQAFDENFMSIAGLIESCRNDWEGQKSLFEDAGAAESMELFLGTPSVLSDWETLLTNTLTMDNSDESGK